MTKNNPSCDARMPDVDLIPKGFGIVPLGEMTDEQVVLGLGHLEDHDASLELRQTVVREIYRRGLQMDFDGLLQTWYPNVLPPPPQPPCFLCGGRCAAYHDKSATRYYLCSDHAPLLRLILNATRMRPLAVVPPPVAHEDGAYAAIPGSHPLADHHDRVASSVAEWEQAVAELAAPLVAFHVALLTREHERLRALVNDDGQRESVPADQVELRELRQLAFQAAGLEDPEQRLARVTREAVEAGMDPEDAQEVALDAVDAIGALLNEIWTTAWRIANECRFRPGRIGATYNLGDALG